MKRLVLLAVLCVMLLTCSFARAQIRWEEGESLFGAAKTVSAGDLGLQKKGTLPVYAAPYEHAYRGAKGKASVSLKESFRLLAVSCDRNWLMIEYATSQKENRVGWIRTPEGIRDSSVLEEIGEISAASALVAAQKETFLTDDPRGKARRVRTVPAGEELKVIRAVVLPEKGSRWYLIDAETEGKPIFGFVPAEDCTKEIPLLTLEGDNLAVREGVTMLGNSLFHYETDETGEDILEYDQAPAGTLNAGSLYIFDLLDLEDEDWPEIRRIVLPSTLRILSEESIVHMHVEELALPEGVREMRGLSLYGMTIGRLVLPSSFTGDVISHLDYSSVGAYEVAPENPVYTAVDGCLFSKDLKTLAAYANGRRDLHYDVPKGTETIGENAFGDDLMAIPLQTISLPIGLKRIGQNAFSGCGRLISLAVPPTVTEIGENAFSYCVSLERLSLPAGFTASLSQWVSPADFSTYNGDNGETRRSPKVREEEY